MIPACDSRHCAGGIDVRYVSGDNTGDYATSCYRCQSAHGIGWCEVCGADAVCADTAPEGYGVTMCAACLLRFETEADDEYLDRVHWTFTAAGAAALALARALAGGCVFCAREAVEVHRREGRVCRQCAADLENGKELDRRYAAATDGRAA